MSGSKVGYSTSVRGPLLDPRFRGSWPLEGLGREEVRLGRRVEADDVVVVSLPCAPPNFNIKSEDAVLIYDNQVQCVQRPSPGNLGTSPPVSGGGELDALDCVILIL